ncbi:MAG: hypothetical protein NTW09_04690, partial [Candidatus Omnitrophica bacterium]|nr:hypothetical protein [Candidatus Omnitrophota bacterium]
MSEQSCSGAVASECQEGETFGFPLWKFCRLFRIGKIWLRTPETKRIYASAKVTFPIYLRFRGQSLRIIFGEPPYNLKTEERITENMLKEAKPILRKRSPLEEALKYAEVYNELTVVSKTQVAMRFGVSRARVCQVMNLLDLDDTIKKYLLSIQDAKEHNFFTEMFKILPC